MQVSAFEECAGQVLRTEGLAGAAVGDHGPLPRPVHEHEDLAGAERGVPGQVRRHAGPLQLRDQSLADDVVADPADEVRLDPERGEPGGRVRTRPAGDGLDRGEGVGAEGDGTLGPRDQVVDQISYDDDPWSVHFSGSPSAESATAMRAARLAFRRMILLLTRKLSPPSPPRSGPEGRRHLLAAHVPTPHLLEPGAQRPVVELRVELLVFGRGWRPRAPSVRSRSRGGRAVRARPPPRSPPPSPAGSPSRSGRSRGSAWCGSPRRGRLESRGARGSRGHRGWT